MNLRPNVQEEPDLNLTSLIDVVLLLLIFFMVSTTFVDETRLRIQLPHAGAERAPRADRRPHGRCGPSRRTLRIYTDRTGSDS